MSSTSGPDGLDSTPWPAFDLPNAVRHRWQQVLDVLSDLLKVPAALVMRVHPTEIEVFARSGGSANPYEEGERAQLDTGLYCETVMASRSELHVPNALQDPEWDHNPDIELGMIAYLGLPLEWPDGKIFGTICVLDNKTNRHSDMHRRVLAQFRTLVQEDVAWIVETERLRAERELLLSQTREAARAITGLQKISREHDHNREMDRAALAEELHNEVVQTLTGAKMDLEMCSRKLPEGILESVQPSMKSITESIDATIGLVRDVCYRLLPPMLQDLGLEAAIEHEISLADPEATRFTFIVTDPVPDLHPWMQLMLFRLVQQSLTQVKDITGVRSVRVELGRSGDKAVLKLTIDGYELTPPGKRQRDQQMFEEARSHAETWGGYFTGSTNELGQAVVEMALPIEPPAMV